MAPPVVTRRAGPEDIDAMLAHMQAGLDSYATFTPPGWRPPDIQQGRETSRLVLGHPDTFALIASVDGSPVGHVAFQPAREHEIGQARENPLADPLIPGLAHFWQLFVLPAWWGQGVAPLLHDAAVDEMRSRGYRAARLFTPSLQSRARRFYERHGWRAGAEHWNEHFQLVMVEYRLALT